MTNYVNNPTDTIPNDKLADPVAYNDPPHQWGQVDANAVFQALRDIRTYLRSGVLDAATTLVVSDIDLTLNTSDSVGPEMDWVGAAGRWFIGVDVANAPTSRDFVLTGVRGSYSFSDGATTSGSATLTSASGGGFVAALVGAQISGAGIPAGTTISAVGGTTTLTMSATATATATGVRVTVTRSTVQDLAYWKHRGGLSPTLGIGVTPPDGAARLQVSPQDDEPAMGTVRLRRGPSQTGHVLALHDSVPTDRLWVDKDFYVSGNHSIGGALVVAAEATNQRALVVTGSDKANFYGLVMPSASGGVCRFACISGGADSFEVGTDGALKHKSTKLGFYNATTITKPTVTGSRGGNAALASLITALANLGLITDSTTA